MKLLSVIKQFVLLKPVIMQFVLEKAYYRTEHHMQGIFHIQTKQPITIMSVDFVVTQTLKIDKKKSEADKIGEKAYREQLALERFEKHAIAFDFPLHFPRATTRERKTYKGDMGPLNKATDKAKKQLYTYTLIATVKLKGKKEPLVYEEKIVVE